MRRNLLGVLARGERLLPGIIGFDDIGHPRDRERAPRRAPHGLPRRARPGEVAHHPRPARRCSTRRVPAVARLRDQRRSVRADLQGAAASASRREGDDARDRLDRPRRALRREARDARRLDRRPDRRDRSRSRSPRAATWPTRRPSTTASSRARNRGIFAINELPDLTEKVQVGLFNLMEEKDVQIKGYKIRLPLDVVIVASANPEDYTCAAASSRR